MAAKSRNASLPTNGVSDDETSVSSSVDTGIALGSNKMRKTRRVDPAVDLDHARRNLDKYRDEMAEDAPASGTPQDRD